MQDTDYYNNYYIHIYYYNRALLLILAVTETHHIYLQKKIHTVQKLSARLAISSTYCCFHTFFCVNWPIILYMILHNGCI